MFGRPEGRPSLPSRSVDHESLGRQDLREVEPVQLLADAADGARNDRGHVGQRLGRYVRSRQSVQLLGHTIEVELRIDAVDHEGVAGPEIVDDHHGGHERPLDRNPEEAT